jgi:putative DNA primase/helicase
MVRSPLVWLGEPDPVSSIEKSRIEDQELSDIRELFELWLDYDLGLDTPYTTACLIETVCATQASNDFNAPVFKDFLLRMAAGKDGKVSAKRLGEWLRRISGRIVSIPRGKYRLVRTQGPCSRAAFHLST